MQHDVDIIYKYMSLEIAILLFSNHSIRMTQISALNDVFENPKILNFQSVMEKVVEKKKSDSGLAVTSYTETPSNLLMWSHYADEYRGVVVGFNTDNVFFVNLKRVRYNEHRGKGNNQPHDSLIIKGNDWIYEKEWRQIWNVSRDFDNFSNKYSTEDTVGPEVEGIYTKSFPSDIITQLYVGPRFENNEDVEKRKLATLINNKHSKLCTKRMITCDFGFKLKVGDIW